jgi:hypothetical protein
MPVADSPRLFVLTAYETVDSAREPSPVYAERSVEINYLSTAGLEVAIMVPR